MGRVIQAAAVQAEPEWLDLRASVEKACKIIAEAATNGAEIVAFPELWVPGYPMWIWARAMDFDLSVRYMKNSLRVDSEEMKAIQACAAENKIVVCLGYSELLGGSTYVGQCTIDSDGKLLMNRWKLKPFHIERSVFGDGDGPSLENVSETTVGRVGQLSCGASSVSQKNGIRADLVKEHFNPLLNFNTFSQGEQIHVAAWPPVMPHPGGPAPYSMSGEAVAKIAQVYSIQAQCFTLHATSVISQKAIEEMGVQQTGVFSNPGGGEAAIFGPDGRKLTESLAPTEEGLVYAELDLDLIVKEKAFLDTVGHFSRPELLWLGRNTKSQKVVRTQPSAE